MAGVGRLWPTTGTAWDQAGMAWRQARMAWRAAAVCLAILILHSTGESVASRRRERINVVTIQSEPYLRLNWQPGLIGNERYEGYYVDLIGQVADHVGFDFQLHLVADGKLGSRGEDGSWDGMVGEILRGAADLSVGPMSITDARDQAVDFTMPIDNVNLTVVMATENHPATMQTLPELLLHRDVIFVVIRHSDAAESLRTSQDADVQRLWQRLLRQADDSFMGNIYEGLEYVRRGKYALILDSPVADYHVGKQPCDLVATATINLQRYYAFAGRKNSELLSEVNRSLVMLKERTGEWRDRSRRWWRSDCQQGAPGVGPDTDRRSVVIESGTTGSVTSSTRGQPVHLRIIVERNAPFVMTSETEGSLIGYTIDLLNKLASAVPFTYDILFPSDNKGLGKKRRGHWNGITGQIVRQEADLAAVPFTPHRSRDRVLSYTKPFLHSTLSFLTRAPSSNDDIPIFLEDLLNRTTYAYGVLRGSHLEKSLKRSRDHVTQRIWENIKADRRRNLIRSIEEGLRKVRAGNFAFILPSTYATYLSSKAPCDLMSLDQFMFITNYMFAVRRGNPLVSKLDEAMIRLQQDSVLQMLFHKWWNTGDCVGATDPNYHDSFDHNATDSSREYQSPIEWVVNMFTSKKQREPDAVIGRTVTTPPVLASGTVTGRSHVQGNRKWSVADEITAESPTPLPGGATDRSEHFRTLTVNPSDRQVAPVTDPTRPDVLKGRNNSGTDETRHRHRHHHSGRSDVITTTLTLAEGGLLEPTARPVSPKKQWDGKYIFHDELTETPSSNNYTNTNYSLELEALPDGDESLRIFPFTYKPRAEQSSPGVSATPTPTDRVTPHREDDVIEGRDRPGGAAVSPAFIPTVNISLTPPSTEVTSTKVTVTSAMVTARTDIGASVASHLAPKGSIILMISAILEYVILHPVTSL